MLESSYHEHKSYMLKSSYHEHRPENQTWDLALAFASFTTLGQFLLQETMETSKDVTKSQKKKSKVLNTTPGMQQK